LKAERRSANEVAKAEKAREQAEKRAGAPSKAVEVQAAVADEGPQRVAVQRTVQRTVTVPIEYDRAKIDALLRSRGQRPPQ
jgi:hypothetical protein